MWKWLVLLLLMVTCVSAEDWVFNSEYIVVDLEIGGDIEIIPDRASYTIKQVTANQSFVPKDSYQMDVLEVETNPKTALEYDSMIYTWDNPLGEKLFFNLDADLRNYNRIKQVKEKITFPLRNIPVELVRYTKPSETIDSDNAEIIKQASEIVAGEDDMYEAVFKLGAWTQGNIEYDLSSLTESVSQSASWVLTNRAGVCDELTNLFIAMNRALGIPAKFVSGLAYTNAEQFVEGFGSHGWAEVWFPNVGWVPFDVTYGEFGFVDASHLKLKEGIDANEATTRYQWLGTNVDIQTRPLDINAEVIDSYGEFPNLVSVDASVAYSETGFGSYNLLRATITNLADYYVATKMLVSKSKEIEIIDEEAKNVLLRPGESGEITWIIKVTNSLESGYVYTFPYIVSSVRNVTGRGSFEVAENHKRYSLDGIEALIDDEEETSGQGSVSVTCTASDSEIYQYEMTDVTCTVDNSGSLFFEGSICLDSCQDVSLGITQSNDYTFDYKPTEAGRLEVGVTVDGGSVSETGLFDITVLDEPALAILDVVSPSQVRFSDMYDLQFLLKKESTFAPEDVKIVIEPLGTDFDIEDYSENRKVTLRLFANELNPGINKLDIVVSYKDKRGNSYKTTNDISIELIDVGTFEHISIWLRDVANSLVGFFS